MNRDSEARKLNTSDLADAGESKRPTLLNRTEEAPELPPEDTERHGPVMAQQPMSQPTAEPARSKVHTMERRVPLVEMGAAESFRSRWNEIQVSFVDEPRAAVERADQLVAETMKQLAESFAAERNKLESQWGRGDQVSTEDLRQALQRYRSYFERLLAA
jgi:hypothetical protein